MSQNTKSQTSSHTSQAAGNISSSGAAPLINIVSITHNYPEGDIVHNVLRDASLDIARGEKVALLGRSGSGKTTLLNLVSGIDQPESGSVIINGQNLTTMNETQRTLFRRRHVGFIYQFFNLVPSLTALENVALTLELNGIKARDARERSLALLARLGMVEKAASFPSRLSGGEQQRVAFARALVHSPDIILADEPTGNLDARTGEEALKVLHEMLEESDSSLLLVTHSLAVAKAADRIVTIEDGLIAERAGDFAW